MGKEIVFTFHHVRLVENGDMIIVALPGENLGIAAHRSGVEYEALIRSELFPLRGMGRTLQAVLKQGLRLIADGEETRKTLNRAAWVLSEMRK